MSIDYRKLFGQKHIILTNTDREALGSEIESVGYMTEYFNKKQKFIPPVDFSDPKNFARFGSAEKYYIDAIDRIYKTYPYDGSLKERIQWELSSSYLDLHIFENGYPRTNGYVILSADGWGTQTDTEAGYGATATSSYEYIFTKGGPNSSVRSKGKGIQDASGDYKSGYANVWDVSKNRESNLKIGGIDGNTVEFWLKKSGFLGASLTNREVLFDAHTSNHGSSSVNYGRLTVELSAAASGSPFRVTYMSGTSGFSYETIGSGISTSSMADDSWHHYAFTFKNSGSAIATSLFIDSACNETIITGSSIDYVSGNINATIGALATSPSGTISRTMLGWGKLSGSLDEFRFWKTARSSRQIGRQYIEPVGGGTNTDDANTTLGVYYKFNEGVTQTSSIDKTVLDYSGRISNGTFVGYNSSARNVGSAMVSSGLVDREFKDPILYSTHPEVVSYRQTKTQEGKAYDFSNNSSIYFTLPAWITEESENIEYSPLRNLTQIIGSYFDSLGSQIESISQFKHKNYLSSSFKPYPFSDRLLQSVGFSYFPELFSDATALEQFRNRDDKLLFKQKLYDVKNRIYQNIYNNIVYIYKTKGTEKSFRNLIRCFGLDDEIYKINLYGNRVTYQLKDNYSSVAEFKKYINFALTGTQEATTFPASSSNNPNSTSFISGSGTEGLETYLAFTMETEVAFPRRHSLADVNTVVQSNKGSSRAFRTYIPFKSASLFGTHQVNGTSDNDLTWASTDYANFQVYAVRDKKHSKRCLFMLTGSSTSVMPTLTSSYFSEVFDDTRWTFSVSIKPSTYPNANILTGSSTTVSATGYEVQFYGVEKVLDTIKNEFFLTSTIGPSAGVRFITKPKSIYIGAHLENFSGTLQQKADGNISSTRVWLSHLATGTIQQHAQDAKNYGTPNPYKSAYLYQSSMTGTRVPEIHTLALNWTFDSLTGSDSNGEFLGQDFSSGSTSLQNRYNWIGNITGKQYLPKGINFPANFSNTINKKYVYSAKKQLPEFINSSDMVNVLSDDDIFFNKVDLVRPTNYYMYIEKSMYQTISEEMIRMFSSIKDFNNLIGEPVNKYRSKYKHMEKLRELFFERVGNTPDLDKYIDFYKWVDQTLDVLLGYLVPASADISDQYGSNIRTLVESHVLERNKYKWQFPTLEDKTPDPEGNILAINELLYDWEFGYDPTSLAPGAGASAQANNCLWWKERAERTSALAGGDTSVDNNKQTMLDSIVNETNAKNYTLYDVATSTTYSGSTYATRRLAKPYKLNIDESRTIKGGANHYPNKNYNLILDRVRKDSGATMDKAAIFYNYNAVQSLGTLEQKSVFGVHPFKDCDDDLELELLGSKKRKWRAIARTAGTLLKWGYEDKAKNAMWMPFSLYSASNDVAIPGWNSNTQFMDGMNFTNLHSDIYGHDKEVPAQSPFTEKFVGGLQYRHAPLNTRSTLDTPYNRAEGWSMVFLPQYYVGMHHPSYPAFGGLGARPDALYYREETAKRPVNIRNIRQTTGSTNIGNYTKDYEILMIGGRSINNRYFVKNEGISASSTSSIIINGIMDYALPGAAQSQRGRQEAVINGLTSSARNDYIIVNRFSAPGDVSTMGFAFLDIESQEYSVYNSLPWRNLAVRGPQQELLTDHTKQFGYFSDAHNSASYALAGQTYPGTSGSVNALNYAGSASFHKVNRNPRRVVQYAAASTDSYIGGVVYDNWYVQHQIPQSDYQYAWITSSVAVDQNGIINNPFLNFEQPDFSNASLASTDITFISQSQVENSIGIKVDFAGMNLAVYDPLTSSLNILSASNGFYGQVGLGTVDSSQMLNALTLHRNGPYEWASWQQIRGENHPIVRAHRKENIQSFLQQSLASQDGEPPKLIDNLISQIEPTITSKFSPFVHNLKVKTKYDDPDTDPLTSITVRHSYGNEKNIFPQKVSGSLNLSTANFIYANAGTYGQLLTSEQKALIYDSLNNFILTEAEYSTNPVKKFVDLTIGEVIYPREHYTYLKRVRQRDKFVNRFWRATRNARDIEGSKDGDPWVNSQGYAVSQSMWRLDTRSRTDLSPRTSSVGIEGELQNGYSLFFSPSDPHAGAFQKPIAGATYSRRNVEKLGDGTVVFAGDTLWEANSQAGVNPFYDNYNSYIEDLKRAGKDYCIIPEFRISEHMDFYINNNVNGPGHFETNNPNKFILTGSSLSSSADASFYTVHTYSDFMKYFGLVRDDYLDIAPPSELRFRCDALIKFLPYDGFYPSERTVQMAQLFSQSYGPTAELEGAGANWRTLLTPLFSPGLLYNSIKSGIAVDYPIVTSSVGQNISITGSEINNSFDSGDARLSGTFFERVPFEALADPDIYFTGRRIIDAEPYISASIISSGTCAKPQDSLYRYAMNNFLAEVPSFFLADGPYGPLSAIESIGDNTEMTFEANQTYKMRIICSNGKFGDQLSAITKADSPQGARRANNMASFMYNSPEITMYNRSFDLSTEKDYELRYIGKNGKTVAYGSSFGPPCDASGSFAGDEASFEPFTPPYYNGYSHIELTYTPPDGAQKYISDILAGMLGSEGASPDYFREVTRLSYADTTCGHNAMQFSASFNWDQQVTAINPKTGEAIESKLVIQPKWECPILDFNSPNNLTNITLPSSGSGSVAKGMWHQYQGSPPEGHRGIYLSVQDVPDPNKPGKNYPSLREKLFGLNTYPRVKLGRVANTKTIREAVVAIPFIPISQTDREYFTIHRDTIDWALEHGSVSLPPGPSMPWDEKRKPATSVVEMIEKMQRYVFPPSFDFLTNEGVDPMAMLIFEFSVDLSQKDLINIWQNLSPNDDHEVNEKLPYNISQGINVADASISLNLLKDACNGSGACDNNGAWKGFDLLNKYPGEFASAFPENIQWIVFKVKQKAKTNYYDLTAKNEMKAGIGGFAPPPKEGILDYSYNWPYDFFSLIELVKIKSEYKFISHEDINWYAPLSGGPATDFGEGVTGEPEFSDAAESNEDSDDPGGGDSSDPSDDGPTPEDEEAAAGAEGYMPGGGFGGGGGPGPVPD